jgi:hypothetical protein
VPITHRSQDRNLALILFFFIFFPFHKLQVLNYPMISKGTRTRSYSHNSRDEPRMKNLRSCSLNLKRCTRMLVYLVVSQGIALCGLLLKVMAQPSWCNTLSCPWSSSMILRKYFTFFQKNAPSWLQLCRIMVHCFIFR